VLGDAGRVPFCDGTFDFAISVCGASRLIKDLIEIQAPSPTHRDYSEVSADWSVSPLAQRGNLESKD
jgi:hypothetical protein